MIFWFENVLNAIFFLSLSLCLDLIVIVRHSLAQVQTQVDRLHRHDADDTVVHIIVVIISHQFVVVDTWNDQQHQKCIKDAILQVSNHLIDSIHLPSKALKVFLSTWKSVICNNIVTNRYILYIFFLKKNANAYQVQMHPNMSKEAHYDAKKDLRNHPMLSRRTNPNIGIAKFHQTQTCLNFCYRLFIRFLLTHPFSFKHWK